VIYGQFKFPNKMNYLEFSNFILRCPAIPYNSYTSLFKRAKFEKENIIELFKDSILVESIFVASPELYDETMKWLSGQKKDKKEEDKLIYSFIKYLSRMETRPTPFGLFAGCVVGSISKNTEIRLFPLENFHRHTRLDMNFLCALSLDLSRNTEIKKKLQYFPNTSLYPLGDKYRYIEYHFEKTRRMHHTVSIQKSTFIDCVLEKCKNGAAYQELIKSVESDDVSFEDAVDFIDELITNQVIVSELEPSTTGPEQLDYILDVLNKIKADPDLISKLKTINSQICKIDHDGLGNAIHSYQEITNIIKETGTTYDKKFLFQTDLILKTQSNTISKQIVDDIKRGIVFLSKFSLGMEPPNLSKFRESFIDRYEDRRICLAEALDTEMGIGYASSDATSGDVNPLVDELKIAGKKGIPTFDLKWNIFQSFLLKKYREALKTNSIEVKVTDEEIDVLVKDYPSSVQLASTFSVMVEVIESDLLNDTYKIHIKNIGGTTGAYLLGRFCHGDKAILGLVNEIIQKEKEIAGEAILAEIVHLPESRTGNVLLRPVLRDYEIPYLARGSVGSEFQLKLEDLFLSVRNKQIVLWSKKLNKIILPRLTNAHNFSVNALPVYQFLCDLQFQGVAGGLGFSWGNLADEHPFLPRVIYKDLILSVARWNIEVRDVKKFFEETEDSKTLEQIRNWRKINNMPQLVLLSDGDNDLFVDLESPQYLRMLWATIKNRQVFKLEEFLFNPDKPLVTGPKGSYKNEIILIFKTENLR
jgi:lantibiotic biosynthesis protein